MIAVTRSLRSLRSCELVGSASPTLMAYGVLGFAVLHTLTRGVRSRPFVLGGTYVSVMILGWPILVLSLLGIFETAYEWRARTAHKRGMPPPV